MKAKIIKITFWVLTSLVFSNLTAQNTKLNVILQDGCGEKYTKNAKVLLKSGINPVVVDSLAVPPYRFSNLKDNEVYYVSVRVDGDPTPDFGLRDIVTLQHYILGVNYSRTSVPYVTDFNNDKRVTAADLANLSLWIFDKINFSDPKWVFTPVVQSLAQPVNFSELVVTPKINETTDFYVNVLKNGEAALATGNYCNNKCPDDPTLAALIYTDSLMLEKDKEYEIPFYAKANKGFFGIASVLDFEDGEIMSVSGSSRINTAQNQVNLLLVSLSSSNFLPLSPELISVIKFKPNKTGNISDFFALGNNGLLQEMVSFNGSCFIRSTNLSLNMIANTVSECDVHWPDDIVLATCNEGHLSGTPSVPFNCAPQTLFTYVDVGSPCDKVQRNWSALDWATGKTRTYTQKINYDQKYTTFCYPDYVVNLSNGDVAVRAIQLAYSSTQPSKFSFSVNDEQDTLRTIKADFQVSEELVLYNHENKTSCIARVIKINCNVKPSKILIKDEISLIYHNGYIVMGSSFDFGSENECTPIRDFQVSEDGSNYFNSISFDVSLAGQQIALFLRYREGNDYVNYGKVTVNLKSAISTNVVLLAENNRLKAFETYTIGITPQNFDKILSFQFGLVFKNIVQDVEVTAGTFPISGSSYYYNIAAKALNIVWYSEQLSPISLSSTEPMIYIRIKPNKDGLLSDFVVQSQELLSTGIRKTSFEEAVDIDFVFGKSVISSVTEPIEVETTRPFCYPNPLVIGQEFFIHYSGLSPVRMVEIFDSKGLLKSSLSYKPWVKNDNETYSIPINSRLTSGLYFVRMNTDTRSYVWKLTIL